ncbi:polysaccharide lyase family 1 protein [Nocardiopsis flavescens]|uniref:pectate lyase family protein n=1 Tax=Nocardiopsis flavescens TaxID=758803 RepID=UPI00364E3176
MRRHLAPALALALTAALTAPPPAAADDTGREVLPAGDGWAWAGGGTTGGAAATAGNVFRVSTPAAFRAAIAGDEPKIVYVDGLIDANTAPDGTPLGCDDYAVDGYSLQEYLETYDPLVWGREDPSGPLEEARDASRAVQAERIRYRVGSNTTIVGADGGGELTGMNLLVQDVRNVILRDLTFSDTHDCFPGWDPGDGETGNWNAEYDHVEVSGSRNVWIDHNTFDDGERPGAAQPEYFGRKYEVHDGLLDIVRAADLVTVSWNDFDGRDKALLLGNSDGRTTDRGYLRVTWHHNHFDGLGQRAPRVRFGQVHVYNNLYTVRGDLHQYSLGAGVESQLHVENNLFDLRDGHTADTLLYNWGGTDVAGSGNALMTGGGGRISGVDLVAEHNAANPDRPLGSEAAWVPQYTTGVQPVHALRGLERKVGAGLL